MGRYDNEPRAFLPGAVEGLSCFYAVLFCRYGFCKHYTVAAFNIPSYNRGDGAQIKLSSLLKTVYGLPG
jgi:hypothetical protein